MIKNLKNRILDSIVEMVSMIINAFFLVLWLFIQHFMNWIVSKVYLSQLDQIFLPIYQIMFALSTLVPVAIYIYTDVKILLSKSGKKVKNSKKRILRQQFNRSISGQQTKAVKH